MDEQRIDITCPECRTKLDTAISFDGSAKPAANTIIVCRPCKAILKVDGKGVISAVTLEFASKLPPATRAEIMRLMAGSFAAEAKSRTAN